MMKASFKMTTVLILFRNILSGFIKEFRKAQIVLAIIFGLRLTAGRGRMLIVTGMVLFQIISIRKSKQSRSQDIGSKQLLKEIGLSRGNCLKDMGRKELPEKISLEVSYEAKISAVSR